MRKWCKKKKLRRTGKKCLLVVVDQVGLVVRSFYGWICCQIWGLQPKYGLKWIGWKDVISSEWTVTRMTIMVLWIFYIHFSKSIWQCFCKLRGLEVGVQVVHLQKHTIHFLFKTIVKKKKEEKKFFRYFFFSDKSINLSFFFFFSF